MCVVYYITIGETGQRPVAAGEEQHLSVSLSLQKKKEIRVLKLRNSSRATTKSLDRRGPSNKEIKHALPSCVQLLFASTPATKQLNQVATKKERDEVQWVAINNLAGGIYRVDERALLLTSARWRREIKSRPIIPSQAQRIFSYLFFSG